MEGLSQQEFGVDDPRYSNVFLWLIIKRQLYPVKKSIAMIKKIVFLLLILTIAHSQTCNYPTESSCLAASCFWGNNVCAVCNCTTCLTGYTYIFSANATGCVPCATLLENNCTALCANYQYAPTLGCIPCSLIDQNCLTCNYNPATNTSQCTQCIINYFINPNDPTNCVPSPCNIPYCSLCATVSTCYSCKPGYQVILNGSACGPSNCTIPNCLTCLSSTVCAVCNVIYLGNNDVTVCPLPCTDPNCAICPVATSCSQCDNGYTYNPTTGYCQLICLVPFCVTCTSSTTCTNCQTNYQVGPFGTSCRPTGPPNCQIAISSTSCAVCQIGFYRLPNGTCAQTICYINQCLVCGTTTSCFQCSSITNPNSNNTICNYVCTSTVNNCGTCNSNTTCSACTAGYLLNTTTNQCVPACTITYCKTCLTDGLCQYCDVNYTLTISGTCVYDCGISSCIACNSSNHCTACLPNYQLSPDCLSCVLVCSPGYYINNVNGNQTCQICNLRIPSCYLCAVTSTQQVTCIQCWPFYYVSGDGTCQLCSDAIDNCLTCDSPAICTQCNTSYIIYTNEIGAALCFYPSFCAVANCLLCTTTDSSICATCAASYQKSIDGKTCTLISCLSTQNYNPVTQACECPFNTYLLNDLCNYCTYDNCASCTSAGCTTCVSGYFISGGYCVSCPSHCSTCTSSTVCTKCAIDYTLTTGNICVWGCGCNVGVTITLANGTVQVCPAGCSYCAIAQGAIYCITPSPGYSFNVNQDIIKCNSNCLTCAISNSNVCTSCEGASILSGIFCLGCIDQYALRCSPTDSSYSLTCIPGFSPFGGVCQACDPNCKTCGNAGAGKCDNGQCNSGYVVIVNTKNCTACFNGCATCSQYDPSICISCSPRDYPSNSSKCLPCNSTCLTCQTATSCSTCKYGYVPFTDGYCYTKLQYPCFSQSGNNCTACYTNFRLTRVNGINTCTLNLTCNRTRNCQSCPVRTYLKTGQCLTCQTSAVTCSYCNPLNASECLTCVVGYYFNVEDLACYTCQSANQGCLVCTSDTTCLNAAEGYYIPLTAFGEPTGNIIKCPESCATCNSPTCITCAAGYTRFGTLCLWQQYIAGTITIGPGPGTEWFTYSQSDVYNLAYAVTNAGQIISSLLTLAGIDATAFENIVIIGMSTGSIKVIFGMTAGPGGDTQEAHRTLSDNLQKPGSDFSVIQSSTTVNGMTTVTGNEGANLGLILGITIPLVILLVVVMIFIKIYSTDTEEKETQETDKGVNEYEM